MAYLKNLNITRETIRAWFESIVPTKLSMEPMFECEESQATIPVEFYCHLYGNLITSGDVGVDYQSGLPLFIIMKEDFELNLMRRYGLPTQSQITAYFQMYTWSSLSKRAAKTPAQKQIQQLLVQFRGKQSLLAFINANGVLGSQGVSDFFQNSPFFVIGQYLFFVCCQNAIDCGHHTIDAYGIRIYHSVFCEGCHEPAFATNTRGWNEVNRLDDDIAVSILEGLWGHIHVSNGKVNQSILTEFLRNPTKYAAHKFEKIKSTVVTVGANQALDGLAPAAQKKETSIHDLMADLNPLTISTAPETTATPVVYKPAATPAKSVPIPGTTLKVSVTEEEKPVFFGVQLGK